MFLIRSNSHDNTLAWKPVFLNMFNSLWNKWGAFNWDLMASAAPIPMVGMVLKFLREQKKNCVMVLPAIYAPWVNLGSAHIVDLLEISKPFQATQFTALNNSRKRIPKKYPHAMIAVKLCFEHLPNTLSYLHK